MALSSLISLVSVLFSSLSCAIKDCIRFEQVGKYECNSEDEVQAARVCSALAYNLFKDTTRNNVRVMVEMNFNGKSFFEEFKRHPLYSPATVLKTYHTKPVPGERRNMDSRLHKIRNFIA